MFLALGARRRLAGRLCPADVCVGRLLSTQKKPQACFWSKKAEQKQKKVVEQILACADLAVTDPARCFARLNAQFRISTGVRSNMKPQDAVDAIVKVAIDQHLYLLAAGLCVQFASKIKFSQHLLWRLVSAFVQFDPEYTPSYLKAVSELHKAFPGDICLSSTQKMHLISSASTYSEPVSPKYDLVHLAFYCARSLGGDPIPVTSLLEVLERAVKLSDDKLVLSVWTYLWDSFPETLSEYSPILVRLLAYFGRRRSLHKQAREVLSVVTGRIENASPALKLAVVRTYTALCEQGLEALLPRLGVLGRALLGELLVYYTAQGNSAAVEETFGLMKGLDTLSGRELGGLVKYVARDSVTAAEALVDSHPGKNKTKMLAHIQLCSQLVCTGDRPLFDKYFDKIQKTPGHSTGLLLNLLLKWQYHHGTPEKARSIYQRWVVEKPMTRDQRVISINTLADLIAKGGAPPDQVLWLLAECVRLGIPKARINKRILDTLAYRNQHPGSH